jgi:anti-sigma B factor antagonist
MEISLTIEEGIALVSPSGNMVANTAEALNGQIVELVSAGVKYVLLDLINIDFMDSNGIMACISINKMLLDSGGMLVCTKPNRAVDKVFRITKADQKLTIAPTKMDGIDALCKELRKKSGKG